MKNSMRPWAISFITLALLLNSGCARIIIRDAEVCGDKGELGATCFHTHNEEMREISEEQWKEERFGQLCMKPEAFANWKAAILNLCWMTKRCRVSQVQKLRSFADKVELFAAETAPAPEGGE